MRFPLNSGWEFAASQAGAPFNPARLTWRPAEVPGTVASSLRALGEWSFQTPRAFDSEDWWYRCHFHPPLPAPDSRTFLQFDGLATLAEVWLNDQPLLRSTDMFLSHEKDVGTLLCADNELLIRFASLDAELQRKRPRPRWKTRLVEKQQLRWIRTSLIGRMPGWSPPVAPVGPWRDVSLEERRVADVKVTTLVSSVEGTCGRVRVAARVVPYDGQLPPRAELTVGDRCVELHCSTKDGGAFELTGELRLDPVDCWWPHTHGKQPLYPARLSVGIGKELLSVDLGKLGFRTLEVDASDGGFGLRVNGVPIFARGACWTTTDVVTLDGNVADYGAALADARAAGMNLLRIGGTHFYEADAFYAQCDELGILVWQDFMFANMDFPADDPHFLAEVRVEATQILQRLSHRPSLAVLCGGSEVEQQSAMLGVPRSHWSSSLFSDVLPAVCRALAPQVPYLPSSPSGGALPFHVDQGVAHYYGVGAYLRPVEDVRRAKVRFASECLAFANIPEDSTLERVVPGGEAIFHHPAWKQRVPRDSGSSWDFEDVRDHYLKTLFGTDPRYLRMHDPPRYLALSRVVPGELMTSTFAEWRSAGSSCRGGLVWFYRDHWPGAGFGVVDSEGVPKPAYYYLKRALAPVTAFFTDEGLNGLWIHAINERDCPLQAELAFSAWKDGDVQVLARTATVTVPARDQLRIAVDGLLEHFADTTYAYRFGPPGHQIAVVEMSDRDSGERLSSAFHFPCGLALPVEPDLGLEGSLHEDGAGNVFALLRARRFAQSVSLDVPGYRCNDNYFHLRPGAEVCVGLTQIMSQRRLGGSAQALNGSTLVRLGRAGAENAP
ncbi:MAG: glycoside hydrolase family 2 protein [Chloroflexota bacterium]